MIEARTPREHDRHVRVASVELQLSLERRHRKLYCSLDDGERARRKREESRALNPGTHRGSENPNPRAANEQSMPRQRGIGRTRRRRTSAGEQERD
jgi:hypothetical protein